jgi:hypothetical protein
MLVDFALLWYVHMETILFIFPSVRSGSVLWYQHHYLASYFVICYLASLFLSDVMSILLVQPSPSSKMSYSLYSLLQLMHLDIVFPGLCSQVTAIFSTLIVSGISKSSSYTSNKHSSSHTPNGIIALPLPICLLAKVPWVWISHFLQIENLVFPSPPCLQGGIFILSNLWAC